MGASYISDALIELNTCIKKSSFGSDEANFHHIKNPKIFLKIDKKVREQHHFWMFAEFASSRDFLVYVLSNSHIVLSSFYKKKLELTESSDSCFTLKQCC